MSTSFKAFIFLIHLRIFSRGNLVKVEKVVVEESSSRPISSKRTNDRLTFMRNSVLYNINSNENYLYISFIEYVLLYFRSHPHYKFPILYDFISSFAFLSISSSRFSIFSLHSRRSLKAGLFIPGIISCLALQYTSDSISSLSIANLFWPRRPIRASTKRRMIILLWSVL